MSEHDVALPASLRKGDRVPAVRLRTWSSDEPFDLRPSRGPRVFVVVDDPCRDECLRYLEAIASEREAVESWGGDVVVVSQRSADSCGDGVAAIGLPVLEDPELEPGDGDPAVVVVDEWGEVYYASGSEATRDPVSPAEVVEWVKFVSIQCPECEGPEGGWKTL